MPFYQTGSAIGADFNNTTTGALFSLNQKLFGSGDTEWVYAKATGAITTGMLVSVGTGGIAQVGSNIIATTSGGVLAFAQGNFADQDYGWFAIRGGTSMNVFVTTTSTAFTQLYISSIGGGAISTAAATGTLLGVQLLATTATVSTVVGTAVLTYPRIIAVPG